VKREAHRAASAALQRAIDRALTAPAADDARRLWRSAAPTPPTALAERVRRRATALMRRDRGRAAAILHERDRLILGLYAAASPRGWTSAFCDGSITQPPAAGIGALLLDAHGRVRSRIRRALRAPDAFAAEIAALEAALRAARRHGHVSLRVYSDCPALVKLWHARRTDGRLDRVRALAAGLAAFELRAVPRAHNRPAHALARRAAG
jgi:ribonuclease HI